MRSPHYCRTPHGGRVWERPASSERVFRSPPWQWAGTWNPSIGASFPAPPETSNGSMNPPVTDRDQTQHATPNTQHPSPITAVPALIISAFAVLHVYLALKYPLAPDETYYWEWSRRPAWGYYDQGPMIAWWIRAGCTVFGETQLGIRAPIILASAFTQVFIYLLTRDLAGSRAAIL